MENYTFNKASKTVTFTDFTTIDLDRILLVTDVTNNTIIYNFADPTTGGTVATNVLTLTYNTNTVSFNDTDKLQIFYEVASGDPYQDRPLKVDGSGVTQPVSLSGGATAANQTSELTKLDTLHTDLGTIDGHVDGLETAVASTNTKLDTLHADVDGLETAVASTNTKLDTVHSDLLAIDGHVDGLETLGTSTNTKLDTLHTDVDGLEAAVSSTNTKLDTLHNDVDGLETAVASTNTKLDTVHTDLSAIDAGIPSALGQGVMSASMSVVVASDAGYCSYSYRRCCAS